MDTDTEALLDATCELVGLQVGVGFALDPGKRQYLGRQLVGTLARNRGSVTTRLPRVQELALLRACESPRPRRGYSPESATRRLVGGFGRDGATWGNEIGNIVPPAKNRIVNYCKITRKVEAKGLKPFAISLGVVVSVIAKCRGTSTRSEVLRESFRCVDVQQDPRVVHWHELTRRY